MTRQHEAGIVFDDSINENIDTMFKYASDALDNMLLILRDIENISEKDIIESYNMERVINNYRNALRAENIDNVNRKAYPYEEGIYYMDIINESEKLGDYIINVVEGVKAQFEQNKK